MEGIKDRPIITVAVDQIDLAPWNYKTTDIATSAKLVASLKRGGYSAKVVLAHRKEEPESDRYEAIDGNHRVSAIREIGIETVAAIYVGRISLAMRQRIGIELNDLRFSTNRARLAEIVGNIASKYTEADMSFTLPYTEEEISDMKNLFKFDPGEIPKETKQERLVDFSFGTYLFAIPESIYALFIEAMRKCVEHGKITMQDQLLALIEAAERETVQHE